MDAKKNTSRPRVPFTNATSAPSLSSEEWLTASATFRWQRTQRKKTCSAASVSPQRWVPASSTALSMGTNSSLGSAQSAAMKHFSAAALITSATHATVMKMPLMSLLTAKE